MSPGEGARIWGGVLYVGSLVFLIVGVVVILADARHVGGDAYNLIINALYGVGWFLLALIFAIVGAVNRVIGELRERVPVPTRTPAPLMAPSELR